MNTNTKLTAFAACAIFVCVALNNIFSQAQNSDIVMPMASPEKQTPDAPTVPSGVKGGPISQGIQITAFVKQTRDNLTGYPLRLSFKIENSAKAIAYYPTSIEERDFTFVVKNSKGESVPMTLRGKSLLPGRGVIFGVAGYSLASGQSRTHTVLLNRVYDLSQTGDYTVTVEREFYLNDKPVEVRSNPVKFSIRDEPSDYREPVSAKVTSDAPAKTEK